MKRVTLAELAGYLHGSLEGDPGAEVSGVAPLHTASPGQVSFLANPRYAENLESTKASAVIVSRQTHAPHLNLILVDDPYLGFARAMEFFHSRPVEEPGVSDRAVVHGESVLGEEVSIHPHAIVCRGARIGSRVTLMPGVYVGPGAQIGDDTVIHPNVVLEWGVRVGKRVIIHAGTVVGSDGFGFARDGDRHRKIVHAGTVRIEDDVEIGAGCTIDRGVFGETLIGQGSKIDNLVQVAHNVQVGRNCLLVAQTGVAGSSELGDGVTLAGQSGIAGHLTVGRGAVVLGKASVFKDVEPGQRVAGTPAIEAGQWRRASAVFARLDELRKRISTIERDLRKIRERNREED